MWCFIMSGIASRSRASSAEEAATMADECDRIFAECAKRIETDEERRERHRAEDEARHKGDG